MSAVRFALGLIALAFPLSVAVAQTHFYAASSEGNARDLWNDANGKRKWTSTGSDWTAATPGNIYHTNGVQIRAGQIGNAAGGKPNPYTFAGAQLIIDGYSEKSGVPRQGESGGEIHFELKSGTDAGPRKATPAKAIKGTYSANIVTAPTSGIEARTIRASVGIITLNGTLQLDGNTRFTTGSINDMAFLINSPITGTGDIEISGGSSGGKIVNGFLLWAFRDLRGWQGSRITVQNKHTISFAGPADFINTNPSLVIAFSATSPGFLNLAADVSVSSGGLRYGKHRVPDGVYTAAELNELHSSKWGGQAAQPFASGKARLFVGQPISGK